MLTRLFGKQVFTDASGGTFDLSQLVNMDVEVEIEHITTSRREDYAYPLVRVRDIRKPGTMQLTDLASAAREEVPAYVCH